MKDLDVQYNRRRNGPNKDKNNVEDILTALHKCPMGLPTFVVSNLSSLPPLDVNNVDFAHLMGEIRAMRADMATLRETVAALQEGVVNTEWPALDLSQKQFTQSDRRPLRVNLPQQ